jgi:hypothetical protein
MISAVVFTALRGLVSDRVYPSTFAQPDGNLPSWPAIRYTITAADPHADLCGTDTGETDDARVQIDVVAKSYGAMVSLRDQVMTALLDLDPPAVRDGSFETYDTETKTHRAVLEYSFYPSSE